MQARPGDASADYSSPPDLSASSATNDKTMASGAKARSVNLIIISVVNDLDPSDPHNQMNLFE